MKAEELIKSFACKYKQSDGREGGGTLEQLFNCHELGMCIAFDIGKTSAEHIEALSRFKEQINCYVIQILKEN